MTLKELWSFGVWKFVGTFFSKDFYTMPMLCKIINVLGTILMAVGVAVFLTASQRGTSNYDYTVKLNAPQPILGGTTLLAENNRIYVFIEEMCAVNVYDENGEFLFCVRGQRNQNGKARMFLYGTDIYIEARNHVIFRFDENGAYCGKADLHDLYDSNDEPSIPVRILKGSRAVGPVYFDDGGIWYRVQDNNGDYVLLYIDKTAVYKIEPEQEAELLDGRIYAAKHSVENGDTGFAVYINKVYKKTDAGSYVFASTPLYLYYIKSTKLGWVTGVVGMLLRILAENLSKRKQPHKAKCIDAV